MKLKVNPPKSAVRSNGSAGSAILTAFRALPFNVKSKEPVKRLTNLRGSFSADILMLVEHPTETELEQNAPFADTKAQLFFSIMEEACPLKEESFLMVPYSRFGDKPNKASTEGTLQFVQEVVQLSKPKCIICVGMSAFAFTFGAGRKTHADTIIGNPMYLPFVNNLPVFVMSDTQRMFPADPEKWRDINFAKECRQQTLELWQRFFNWYSTI